MKTQSFLQRSCRSYSLKGLELGRTRLINNLVNDSLCWLRLNSKALSFASILPFLGSLLKSTFVVWWRHPSISAALYKLLVPMMLSPPHCILHGGCSQLLQLLQLPRLFAGTWLGLCLKKSSSEKKMVRSSVEARLGGTMYKMGPFHPCG